MTEYKIFTPTQVLAISIPDQEELPVLSSKEIYDLIQENEGALSDDLFVVPKAVIGVERRPK